MAIISKEEVSQLLDRPLTDREDANFDAYVTMAQLQLEALVGYSLESASDPTVKTIHGTDGYRTVATPPYSKLVSVKLNGETLDPEEYRPDMTRQLCAGLVLCRSLRSKDVLEVEAHWGFEETPAPIKLLLADLFASVSADRVSAGQAKVKSETVLSHSVSYDSSQSLTGVFTTDNADLLALYTMPKSTVVDSGRILWRRDDDISQYHPYY